MKLIAKVKHTNDATELARGLRRQGFVAWAAYFKRLDLWLVFSNKKP
jgi:hypothetical protein